MKYLLWSDVQYVKGVGPKVSAQLKNLGVKTVEDLLTLPPRRYVKRVYIKDISPEIGEVRVRGKITEKGIKRTSSGSIFIVKISDGTGSITSSFFHYSIPMRERFKWGTLIEIEGVVSLWGKGYQIVNPSVSFSCPEDVEEFLPVYPLTGKLTHSYIRKIVKTVFSSNPYIPETLPDYILGKQELLSKEAAIRNLHFPSDLNIVEKVKDRLEFEELFWLEIILGMRKRELHNTGIKFKKGSILARKFFNILTSERPGFNLTAAQRKVCWEIFEDMESDSKMNRLLQGDVGAGKTIIAMLSMLKAVESDYQVVLMAPTEILAEQHYICLNQYLPQIGIRCDLLIGRTKGKQRKELLETIKSGESQIIVGTHALIEGNVEFKNLGFTVIDEQHKFGVAQRSNLMEKGKVPDMLVLTATPIPRSLALILYGNLDISVIDELPPGVKPIITKWKYEDEIDGVWQFVISELKINHQAYIVYPVIEESDKLDLKAAEDAYKSLSKTVFRDFKVGLLHGRMKSDEKARVMESFRNKEIHVLVATTIIEVGIDIPNASCMVIEHSERFGLAQLHQLRGRLNRGTKQSYCMLVSPRNISTLAQERLRAIEKERDGFKLAEKDLELRGPGDFLGTMQHGFPEFKFANIMDTKFISEVRDIAFKIIEEDPYLKNPKNQRLAKALRYAYAAKAKFLSAG